MPWIEVHLATTPDLAPDLEDALLAAGAQAVTLQDAGDGPPVLEPQPGTHPVWDDVDLVALFGDDVPVAAVVEEAAGRWQQEHDTPFPSWQVRQVEERDWVDAWRQHWQPMCVGGGLWVLPPDTAVPTAADGTPDQRPVLHLEPGLAFGTGTHPTTFLCMEWLVTNAETTRGRRMVDYGCGSGILGLAALKCGVDAVLATDHDPQALEATAANAVVNGFRPAELQTFLPDALPLDAVHLVVANILAGPLVELAPRLRGLLAPGGVLVLAGMLEDQVDAVMAAYPDLHFDDPESLDGWTRLVGRAAGAAPER